MWTSGQFTRPSAVDDLGLESVGAGLLRRLIPGVVQTTGNLAKCLSTRKAWTPLQWEQLESLAHQTATAILDSDEHAATAAAGASLAEITERLRPYADRSAWDGYLTLADELLDRADIHTEPFLWVEGEDWIDSLENASTWTLIGYGAIVGFRDKQTYASAGPQRGAAIQPPRPRPHLRPRQASALRTLPTRLRRSLAVTHLQPHRGRRHRRRRQVRRTRTN